MDGGPWVKNRSQTAHRSESKKRDCMEIEEISETSQKSVKMRDLESVFVSEGRGRSVTESPNSRGLDLNVDIDSANCMAGDDDPACANESNNQPAFQKEDMQQNGLTKASDFDFDLNAADVSSSISGSFYPYKKHQYLRSTDDSDCMSSVGPLHEKDPMRVWKGLKQNNYLSNRYGVPPAAMPKARGRKKSNNDIMKKKIELAKKEQADRFARVAAPSGLLNGLNPGIINHVRNSNQVQSIIKAIVESERKENHINKPSDRKEAVNVHGSAELSYGYASAGRRHASDYAFFPKSMYANIEAGDSHMGYARIYPRMSEKENEDDRLPPSAAVGTENASCLSSDDSANVSSVTSLSLKAANIASQWLELLNQDIRGRLAALRRSKKRVCAVISTELPLLMSREFSSNLDKDKQTTNFAEEATGDAHFVKWNTLFAQMDKSLSEEEGHLENWLNQVKEMQLHCEMGLNTNSLPHPLEQKVSPGNSSRENSDKDLAVRAAAASIYSTCNFLLSRENLPCY